MIDVDTLSKRGWTDKEIVKIRGILAEQKPLRHAKLFELTHRFLYWFIILIAIIVNMLISVVVIPFLIVTIRDYRLYIFLALMGFIFGLFFDLIVNQINIIQYGTGIIEGVFIPAMAFVNMFFIFRVIMTYRLVTLSLPAMMVDVVLYGLFFMMPYLFSVFAKNMRQL